MSFLKTSLLSAISTMIKLVSGLVVTKVIAIYIGPAGIALIGQFQNFLNVIRTLGNGAINSGVTKYVAEYNEKDNEKRDAFISASFIITFFVSGILGTILFFTSSWISRWMFQTEDYSGLFKVLGTTLGLIGLNTIILSIINGLKRFKLFIIINIIGSLLSLVLTYILTVKYNLWGALLSTILVQSLLLTVSLPIALKKLKISFAFQFKLHWEYYKKLFAFSLMSIISVICVAVSQILIRNHLTDNFSLKEAGYWQSVWMISAMYLMILTTAFSTYYLPRLSELKDPNEIRKEILSGYKIIIPFVIITATMIFFMKDIIIVLLYTKDFYPMRELFFYQLMGDFFKMCSWTLSFLMIAKGMTRTFIVTEIIFSASFFLLTVGLTSQNGLEGVVQAHLVNYILYFIVMILIFKDILKKNIDEK